MDRSEFQRLLNEEAPAPPDCLPDDFASEVLTKGRHLRRLLQQHWKWLSVASVVSLVIAIVLGLGAAPSDLVESRPPLLLFQSNDDTAPFSSK